MMVFGGTLMNRVVCDSGGPITAGDQLFCKGPYLTRCAKKPCDCVLIAMNDATFTFPLEEIPVLCIHLE